MMMRGRGMGEGWGRGLHWGRQNPPWTEAEGESRWDRKVKCPVCGKSLFKNFFSLITQSENRKFVMRLKFVNVSARDRVHYELSLEL